MENYSKKNYETNGSVVCTIDWREGEPLADEKKKVGICDQRNCK